MTVLVAGGSGFVGLHLVDALVAAGSDVRVMTRSPSDSDDGRVRQMFGDVSDPASLVDPLTGVDVAYYLVHSLGQDDFARRDAAGAQAFGRQAADSGVRRVVYLGGLGDESDNLSDHLRSRREVEQILAAEVDTVALRAGIVVGQGSVSWEILCQLVERLLLMVTPKWVSTRTQPVALADATRALVEAANSSVPVGHYEIGAPESCSYSDMLKAVARHMHKRLIVVPVPILSPRLSSWWLRLVTDVDLTTARNLVDSMTNDAVVTDRSFEQITGHAPMRFEDAVAVALGERERR